MSRIASTLVVLILVLSVAIGSETQNGSPVVESRGSVVVRKAPSALRVSIDLFAHGDDYCDALLTLEARIAAARTTLVGHGFSVDTIVVGAPSRATQLFATPTPALALESTVEDPRPTAPQESLAGQVAYVSATLIADFPLSSESLSDTLVTANEIEQKLKQDRLSGFELLKQSALCKTCGNIPGEPRLSFVAQLTDEDLEGAEAACYRRAEQSARRIAKSGKVTLGRLNRLQSRVEIEQPAVPVPQPEPELLLPSAIGAAAAPSGNCVVAGPTELCNTDPAQLRCQVVVDVSFMMTAPGDR